MGRNANFTGEGFAEQSFNVKAMPPEEYDEWVDEVKATAEPLTEEKFDELLEPGRLGQLTFTGTHLEFAPPPEAHYSEGSTDTEETDSADSPDDDPSNMNH
jgi:cytochrome aa3-600 menaquinol oxidase subunit 2